MPKIITAKRLEGELEKAQEYVKVHILFPSGLLGLVFLVGGTFALFYQFFTERYGWRTFVQSSLLLIAGGVLGWAQTRYHRYLLREHPEHFASRMRAFTRKVRMRPKRDQPEPELAHPGRRLVPWAYLGGIGSLLCLSFAAATVGQVYFVASFLLPWAGFFWAKTFFWRRLLGERATKS